MRIANYTARFCLIDFLMSTDILSTCLMDVVPIWRWVREKYFMTISYEFILDSINRFYTQYKLQALCEMRLSSAEESGIIKSGIRIYVYIFVYFFRI